MKNAFRPHVDKTLFKHFNTQEEKDKYLKKIGKYIPSESKPRKYWIPSSTKEEISREHALNKYGPKILWWL